MSPAPAPAPSCAGRESPNLRQRRQCMPLRRAIAGRPATNNNNTTPTTQSAAAVLASGRAMRYYRLWIYACNTCLLAGALAFAAAAARTALFDFRRALVPQLALYQPSFMYGYLALATQGGALQLLGCVAALKLSERLLNAYWLLLLVLLFGDVVLGAFWAFRFERICQELKPALRIRFYQEYSTNNEFTEMWNRLQSEASCCGVSGPDDYNSTGVQMPIPVSCCVKPPPSATATANSTCAGGVTDGDALHHSAGCDDRLLAYLRSTASLLAILGYCVLAFLKVCFLGILRYEIREMIQKIRILRTELELPNANGAVPGAALRADNGSESEREALLVRPESAALLSSPPPTAPQPKNTNGNNNYEMREYSARYSLLTWRDSTNSSTCPSLTSAPDEPELIYISRSHDNI